MDNEFQQNNGQGVNLDKNGNNQGGQPYPQYQCPPPQQKNPTFTKDLILSIVQLCCCCTVTGIISLIFVLQGNSAFDRHDYATYESNTKTAKTARIVGWIIAGVIVAIYLIYLIFCVIIGVSALASY